MNVRLSENLKRSQEMIVVITGKWLGEKICKIVSRGYLFEQDRPGFDKFTKIMVSDVNMLHLSVVLHSLHKSNRPATISPYDPWFVVLDFHLIQPRLHPYHLLGTSGHCNIFSFNIFSFNS